MEFLPDTLVLDDGRRLAYASLGPHTGFPVVYLHGGIGTTLAPEPEPGLVAAVEQHGVRWIALQRPGFGGSDDDPGRSLATVAADVRALALAHGWQQIAVVGVSSGAPYALACAAESPALVAAVALAAPVAGRCAPHRAPGIPRATRVFLAWLLAAPRMSAAVLGVAARLLRCGERLVAAIAGPSRAPAVRALSAAVAGGVRGPIADFRVCAQPWKLDLTRVRAEVHVWHGLRDRLVPAEHAWELAAALPHGRLSLDATETHFFFRRRSAEIAGELMRAVARARPDAPPGRGPAADARCPGRPARLGG